MLRFVYYALWIAPALVFVLLSALMMRRGTRKQFPLFFSYSVFQVVSFIIQFSTYHRNAYEYFYAYWTLAALSIGLGLAVVHEVFTEVFRPFIELRDLGSVLFRWAALVLVLAAFLMASTTEASHVKRLLALILTMERSIRVIQCGLVLLMLLCSSYLGISWRNRVFGISLGFGLIASVDLIIMTVASQFGRSAATYLNLIKMSVYMFASLLWTRYMWWPEPERETPARLPIPERWEWGLAAATNGSEGIPSLPRIVDAVDRVMKHNGKTPPMHADQ